MSWEIVIFLHLLQCRIKTFQHDDAESSEAAKSGIIPEDQNKASDNKISSTGNSFLSILGILLGIAAVITLILASVKLPSLGTSTGIQFLQDGSSSSSFVAPTGAFTFRALGYTVVLPQYAPGCAFNYLPYLRTHVFAIFSLSLYILLFFFILLPALRKQ